MTNRRSSRGNAYSRTNIEREKGKDILFQERHVEEDISYALKVRVIILLEPKRPNQMHMIDNSNYCPYHILVSYSIEECYIFKDCVEK